jgi:hypothetical protein
MVRYYFCLILSLLTLQVSGQYSDHFEDMSGMHHWQIFHSGDPVYYESLMYSDSLLEGSVLTDTEGRLVMVCGATYWYAGVTGPYVYQLTWGDFSATTRVWSLDRNDPSMPPQYEFNSTGLILRNPDASNGQNYVMTNLGMQAYANGIGTESKTTINSISTLYLDPDDYEGEVRITRTGTMIRTYKRTGGDIDFVLLDEFDRPDIPDTVQIGMVLNGYTNTPDIRGEFDYIHFNGGDCRIVRNTSDTGINSLREAIACAEAGDTITFDHVLLTDTIEVDSEPLLIDKNLVLLNARSNRIALRGTGLSSVISIPNGIQVTIQGIAFIGTDNPEQHVILNQGSLSLVDCTVNAEMPAESAVMNEGTLIIRGQCDIR